MRFTWLQPSDSRLAPEHRAQYLTINQLIKWDVIDPSGAYSGMLIFGEQIVGVHPTPKGFLPDKNMTIDLIEKEVPAAKVRELSFEVNRTFFDPYIGWRVTFGSSTVQ